MTGKSLRRLGFGLLAGAGIGLVGLTSATHAYADDTAFVIGYPIAADEALVPLAGLIDFAAIVNAAQTIATDPSAAFS
jgi:hypothetical protein